MFRNILIVFFSFLTLYTYAQTITRSEVDEATNTYVITTSPWNDGMPENHKGEHAIFPYFKYLLTEKGRGMYFLSFIIKTDKDIGCLMEKSGNVKIQFVDGQEIALKQHSDTNCDFDNYKVGYYLVNKPQAQDVNWVNEMTSQYDMLHNKPIKKILVEGSRDVAIFNFRDNKTKLLMNHAKLLSNEVESSATPFLDN